MYRRIINYIFIRIVYKYSAYYVYITPLHQKKFNQSFLFLRELSLRALRCDHFPPGLQWFVTGNGNAYYKNGKTRKCDISATTGPFSLIFSGNEALPLPLCFLISHFSLYQNSYIFRVIMFRTLFRESPLVMEYGIWYY